MWNCVVVVLHFISSVPAPIVAHTHENHTQGLETAFERGEVSSWIDFFRRGALTPLYHDRFPKLSEELREALANGDEAAANLLSVLNKVGYAPCTRKYSPKQDFLSRVTFSTWHLFHLCTPYIPSHCRLFITLIPIAVCDRYPTPVRHCDLSFDQEGTPTTLLFVFISLPRNDNTANLSHLQSI